jgi:hypothetical protein
VGSGVELWRTTEQDIAPPLTSALVRFAALYTLCLNGDDEVCFTGVCLHLTFDKSLSTQDLISILTPAAASRGASGIDTLDSAPAVSPLSIRWINDESAFAILRDPAIEQVRPDGGVARA